MAHSIVVRCRLEREWSCRGPKCCVSGEDSLPPLFHVSTVPYPPRWGARLILISSNPLAFPAFLVPVVLTPASPDADPRVPLQAPGARTGRKRRGYHACSRRHPPQVHALQPRLPVRIPERARQVLLKARGRGDGGRFEPTVRSELKKEAQGREEQGKGGTLSRDVDGASLDLVGE